MPNTRMVFDADAAGVKRGMAEAEASLRKTGVAVDDVRAKLKNYYQAQIRDAQEAGKSQEQLDRMQQKAAENLSTVTEQNAARRMAALDRLLTKERAVAAELAELGKVSAISEHGVSDRMATSAAVRGLEGNPGIRSIENFITMSPVAAKAMQSLFPLIGGAGLAGLLFEMGEKGWEAFEKVQHGAEATRLAFEEQHGKLQILIDDREILNQKLQDEIDKLSGHPNNGAATALLEAKKRADELLESLKQDRHELEQLFKQQDTGLLGKAMSALGIGPTSTGTQEKEILGDMTDLERKLRGAKDTYTKAFGSAKDDAGRQAATQAYNKATHDAFQERIDTYKRERKRLEEVQNADHVTVTRNGVIHSHADASKQIANIDGVISQLEGRQQVEGLDESIYARQQKVGGLKQGKEGDDAARKAAAQQLKALEAQAAQLELDGATPKAIFEFWERNIGDFEKGSDQFNSVLEKQAGIAKSGAEKVAKAIAEARGGNTLGAMDMLTGRKEPKPDEGGKASQESLDAVAKMQRDQLKYEDMAATTQAKLQARIRESSLNLARSQGQLSPSDYAQQMQGLHTSDYAAEQLALQKRVEDAKTGTMAEQFSAREALWKAEADRQVQIQQDAANVSAATWTGAWRDAMSHWVQDATDGARQAVQVTQQALNGINDNLVNAMSGDKTDWRGMFKGVGKSVSKDALEQLEGNAMKALGLGNGAKADGSKANPFYVISADTAAGGMGGMNGAGGLLKSLWPNGAGGGDNSDSDSSDSGGGGFGGFVGGLLKFGAGLFGGGRAVGGGVQPGVAYDVGEMGRERFVPSVPGTIVPNNALGGNQYYSLNVQKGVTPEEMRMHVDATMRAWHPQIVAHSVQAMQDRSARMPSSAR